MHTYVHNVVWPNFQPEETVHYDLVNCTCSWVTNWAMVAYTLPFSLPLLYMIFDSIIAVLFHTSRFRVCINTCLCVDNPHYMEANIWTLTVVRLYIVFLEGMGGVILELGIPVPLSLAYCFLHLWHSVQYITVSYMKGFHCFFTWNYFEIHL